MQLLNNQVWRVTWFIQTPAYPRRMIPTTSWKATANAAMKTRLIAIWMKSFTSRPWRLPIMTSQTQMPTLTCPCQLLMTNKFLSYTLVWVYKFWFFGIPHKHPLIICTPGPGHTWGNKSFVWCWLFVFDHQTIDANQELFIKHCWLNPPMHRSTPRLMQTRASLKSRRSGFSNKH